MIVRCRWASNLNDERMIEYHDSEYGVMIFNNDKLFELLSLELMQSGLSWKTVLDKRAALNKYFCGFIINKVSKLTNDDIIDMLKDDSIIRHAQKLNSIVNNARVIEAKKIHLLDYIQLNLTKFGNNYQECAKQYKKDGFKFIGPSTIESLYHALGLVEGHDQNCFKYQEMRNSNVI